MYYMYLVDRIGGSDVVRRAVMRAPGGSFADPAFVEAGTRVQELVKAGAFAQGFNGLDYDIGASRRLLYSGRAAMELIGSWEASTVKAENPAFYSGKHCHFFVRRDGPQFSFLIGACNQIAVRIKIHAVGAPGRLHEC